MILEIAMLMQAASVPPNPDWNCEDPTYQQEMNWCAHQDYLAADAKLNEQWAETAAVMKTRDEQWDKSWGEGPGYFQVLLDAQRAWLAYRDAHCTSEGYYARGGSIEPVLVSTCKSKLTKDRTQALSFLIEQ